MEEAGGGIYVKTMKHNHKSENYREVGAEHFKKGMVLGKFSFFEMPKSIFSSPKGKPQLIYVVRLTFR